MQKFQGIDEFCKDSNLVKKRLELFIYTTPTNSHERLGFIHPCTILRYVDITGFSAIATLAI